ncbi:unnamed protein product [Lathyrus oleraceus]
MFLGVNVIKMPCIQTWSLHIYGVLLPMETTNVLQASINEMVSSLSESEAKVLANDSQNNGFFSTSKVLNLKVSQVPSGFVSILSRVSFFILYWLKDEI